MKKLLAVITSMATVAALTSCGSTKKEEKKTIGIAMPASELERWNSDGEYLKSEFEAAGYDVELVYSNNDATKQNNDLIKLISDKVDLLLVAAVDGTKISDTLDSAKTADIPIVAYDRLIMKTSAVNYYISFDNYAVGKLQAEFVKDKLDLKNSSSTYNIEFIGGDPIDNNARYFFDGAYETLQPYIESGKLNIPSGKNTLEQVATKDWTTANAESNMKSTLSSYYTTKSLDVALCSNDSTALGVTKAIGSDYKGSNAPIITGQDGDAENLRNIVDGKQSMTVYKNLHDEAKVAFEVCKTILSDETPAASLVDKLDVQTKFDTDSYNNGTKYIQSYLLEPTVITADNLQLLVNTGLYKWDSSNKYLELVNATEVPTT